MDKELWRDILGYEGSYAVSNQGNVKSIARRLNIPEKTKGGRRAVRDRILKQGTTPNGYKTVSLRRNNATITRLVHSLVLESFIGLRPTDMVCRHFPDKDKTNNNINNLQWGTSSENQEDRKEQGTSHLAGRKKTISSQLCTSVCEEYSKTKTTQRLLAVKYGISLSAVNKIVNNK